MNNNTQPKERNTTYKWTNAGKKFPEEPHESHWRFEKNKMPFAACEHEFGSNEVLLTNENGDQFGNVPYSQLEWLEEIEETKPVVEEPFQGADGTLMSKRVRDIRNDFYSACNRVYNVDQVDEMLKEYREYFIDQFKGKPSIQQGVNPKVLQADIYDALHEFANILNRETISRKDFNKVAKACSEKLAEYTNQTNIQQVSDAWDAAEAHFDEQVARRDETIDRWNTPDKEDYLQSIISK